MAERLNALVLKTSLRESVTGVQIPEPPLFIINIFKTMNEVTVTVLPHPVTMFMLGGMLLGLILLFMAYMKTSNEVKEYKRELRKINDNLEVSKVDISKAVNEISRKVDSRIDKALGSIKK